MAHIPTPTKDDAKVGWVSQLSPSIQVPPQENWKAKATLEEVKAGLITLLPFARFDCKNDLPHLVTMEGAVATFDDVGTCFFAMRKRASGEVASEAFVAPCALGESPLFPVTGAAGNSRSSQLRYCMAELNRIKGVLMGMPEHLAWLSAQGKIELSKFNDECKMNENCIRDVGIVAALMGQLASDEKSLALSGSEGDATNRGARDAVVAIDTEYAVAQASPSPFWFPSFPPYALYQLLCLFNGKYANAEERIQSITVMRACLALVLPKEEEAGDAKTVALVEAPPAGSPGLMSKETSPDDVLSHSVTIGLPPQVPSASSASSGVSTTSASPAA